MDNNLINISFIDLTIGACLIIISVGLSRWKELNLERDLIVASIRTFLQLIGVGFILKYVFESNRSSLILIFILIMLIVAVWTVVKGQKSKSGNLSLIVSFSL